MSKALGRRYAKALIELYQPTEFEAVDAALRELSKSWEDSLELQRAILNPAFKALDRANALSAVFEKARPGDSKFKNLAALLVDSGRAKAIPAIAEAFSAAVAQIKKLLALEITSARAVDESERKALSGSIERQFGSLASLSWNINESLIGGLVVKSGDKMLDGSVKGSLDQIRRQLLA